MANNNSQPNIQNGGLNPNVYPHNNTQGNYLQPGPSQEQKPYPNQPQHYNQAQQGYNPEQPYYPQPNGYTPQFQQVVQPTQDLRKVVDEELEKIVPKEFSRWFGSIQYRPRKMSFATQNVGEKIYVLVRMHWIRNIGWILNNIFYTFIPFIVLGVLQLLSVNLEFLSIRIFVIILLAYYSIIFSNVIKDFYDWYFDVYIVTNERILDYVFDPFKGYHVTEAPLESIQDVEEKSMGFLADIFNYGSVKARTASNAGELSFDYIADPTRVRDIIMDLAKIIKSFKNRE